MAPLTFADTHNMIAFLSKSDASAGFDQIVDFLNTQVIHYALMVNPTIFVSCIKQFWATASIKNVNDVVKLQALIDRKKVVVTEDIIQQDLRLDDADGVECLPTEKIFAELARLPGTNSVVLWPRLSLATGRKFNFSKYIFDNMVRNVDSPSKFLMYPRFLQVLINNQVDDLSSYTIKYTSPTLTQKVFANMRRIGKGFSDVETHLFSTMLVQPQAAAEEEDEKDEVPAAPTLPLPTHEPSPPLQEPITSSPQAQPAPPSSPPQEQPTTTSTSDMNLLNTLMETCITLSHKVAALEQDKIAQALEIFKLNRMVKKLKKKRGSKSSGFKRLKKVAIDADEDITLVDMETEVDLDDELQGRIERKDDDNAAAKEVNVAEPIVFDDEEVTMTMAQTLIKMKDEKTRILDEQMAKRLHDEEVEQAAVREKQEQDDFKRAQELQQQYDQKRKTLTGMKNMIVYLKNMAGYKMAHFRGMTYDQSFEDMLKAFDREDLDALWRLVKQKLSTAVPIVDKEKALWVELKRLFKPDADDVIWKLQRHDMYMLAEKEYPLSNEVLTLMLSTKLQVEEDSEMARYLVMKIFMKANQPKSKTGVDVVQGLTKNAPKELLLMVEVLVLLVQVNVVRQK
nr:hypothetical protein [Tanacetum cinerariifolium]